MYRLIDINRPISEYSDAEFELQKACYRNSSILAIRGMKKLLLDLFLEGVFVKLINIYEQSPSVTVFPNSVQLLTGKPMSGNEGASTDNLINVSWDFWRNEVIQHVIVTEVI